MSFCRWSSEDFLCDLYVYESMYGGYVIHVAKMRVVYTEPLPPPIDFDEDPAGYVARLRIVTERAGSAKRQPILLAHAGETMSFETAKECLAKMEELRAIGYAVPDYALAAMRAEAGETDGKEDPA